MVTRRLAPLCVAVALLTGCASPSAPSPGTEHVEVAFSPEAGAQTLVLNTLNSAQRSVRLAGYSFTSPEVVSSLIEAHKRGVAVKVLVDDRGNRSTTSTAALRLLVASGIPVRTISTYSIHHGKYIVVDEAHTQTGSFNYSRAAAQANSENVIVIWNNVTVAALYTQPWLSRWTQGKDVPAGY